METVLKALNGDRQQNLMGLAAEIKAEHCLAIEDPQKRRKLFTLANQLEIIADEWPAAVSPTTTTTLAPREASSLAFEVYDKLYRGTESFEDIGTNLAYLLGAISGGNSGLSIDLEKTDPLYPLLLELFPEEHRVWDFVAVQ